MFEHLICRPATAGNCGHCGATVIRAVVAGVDITTDTQPIDLITELRHRVAGQMTFAVLVLRQSVELDYRDQWRIRSKQQTPVVAVHICPPNAQRPKRLLTPVPLMPHPPPVVTIDQEPPF